MLQKTKLKIRAGKYRKKHDAGGIAYMHSVISAGDTVFDIGAHKAGYLYFMAKLTGSAGNVYAFEPQRALYNYLVKMKALFAWNHVMVEHLALSDNSGSTKLFIPVNKADSTSSPGASIVNPQPGKQIVHTETIQTVSLDAYCQNNEINPTFLKIDVEGNELNVFKGAQQILVKHKPKILVEIEARHIGKEQAIQTFRFLESIGYKGHFIRGVDLLPLSEFQFEVYQDTTNMKHYCNNFVFD